MNNHLKPQNEKAMSTHPDFSYFMYQQTSPDSNDDNSTPSVDAMVFNMNPQEITDVASSIQNASKEGDINEVLRILSGIHLEITEQQPDHSSDYPEGTEPVMIFYKTHLADDAEKLLFLQNFSHEHDRDEAPQFEHESTIKSSVQKYISPEDGFDSGNSNRVQNLSSCESHEIHTCNPPMHSTEPNISRIVTPVKQSTSFSPAQRNVSPLDTLRLFLARVNLRVVDTSIFLYTGTHYQRKNDVDIKRIIGQVCHEEYAKSDSPAFIQQVFNALMLEPSVVMPECRHFPYVSFTNGVVNVLTNELHPHSPKFFTTFLIQAEYHPNIHSSPYFDQYLAFSTGNNPLLINRIWEVIGYLLSSDTRGKSIFLLQGCPNSGKSVLSTFLTKLINPEASLALDVHTLGERFAVSDLEGKVLCVSPDMPSGFLDRRSTSKLKQLSGGDLISADVKFKNRIQFVCTARFLLATNHALILQDSDSAFWDRIVAIPFNFTVPQEHRNPHLIEFFLQEREAIVSRALSAYQRLVDCKYRFSGDFPPNSSNISISGDNCSCSSSQEETVIGFAEEFFSPSVENGLFVSDIHKEFQTIYGPIPLNLFSQIFVKVAHELFGAEKARKHKPGYPNAMSFLSGIQPKTVSHKTDPNTCY